MGSIIAIIVLTKLHNKYLLKIGADRSLWICRYLCKNRFFKHGNYVIQIGEGNNIPDW